MSKLEITTETAFETGVEQGRKQMAEHILEIMDVSSDPEVLKRYINCVLKQEKNDIKSFFKGIRQDEN
jgi:hypothetical protein